MFVMPGPGEMPIANGLDFNEGERFAATPLEKSKQQDPWSYANACIHDNATNAELACQKPPKNQKEQGAKDQKKSLKTGQSKHEGDNTEKQKDNYRIVPEDAHTDRHHDDPDEAGQRYHQKVGME